MKILFLNFGVSGGTMKALRTWAIGIVSTLLLPALVCAAPSLINYQGRLVDTAGNPLIGSQTITFRIYNVPTGGTALWTEPQTVTPDNGIFSVSLGSVNSLTVSDFLSDTLYLGITIAPDVTEMTPRTRLLSTPYALYTANLGSSGTQALISTDTVISGSQLRLGNFLTASLPAGMGGGSLVYDSQTKFVNFWNGTNWIALAQGGASPWSTSSGLVYLGNNDNNVGVGTGSPAYRLHVSSAAGEAGDILVVSTGATNLFRVNGLGEVRAAKYYGDGSALTSITAANISGGLLGATVVASSAAVDSVYTNSILAGAVTKVKLAVEGCADGQIMKLSGGAWACGTDNAGAGAMATKDGGVEMVSATSAMDFDGDQFNITEGPVGQANIVMNTSSVTLLGPSIGAAEIEDSAVTNVKLAGSITDGKLNTITTAGKVAPGAIAAGSLLNTVIASSIAIQSITSENQIVDGVITSADLAGSIAYSKLNLTGAVLNADLAGSIAYSKLNLTGAVLDADLAGSIADSKLNTITTAGKVAPGAIAAGSLLNTVIASSIAIQSITSENQIVDGVITSADLAGSIADSKLATITTAGKVEPGAIAAGTLGALVVASSVPAANVGVGQLGPEVLASSVAVNSVFTGAIADSAVTDGKIAGMSASKLSGTIPQTVTMFSDTGCDLLTPAAAGQFCYDTTVHMLSVSTSTEPGGYAAIAMDAVTTW